MSYSSDASPVLEHLVKIPLHKLSMKYMTFVFSFAIYTPSAPVQCAVKFFARNSCG